MDEWMDGCMDQWVDKKIVLKYYWIWANKNVVRRYMDE